MKHKYSTILGWITFAIAWVVYLLTIEPTASFWDCTEFIACAGKLEIGHAPGAPTFMLLGRFFSLFAGGDVTKIAMMINILSATASALTIMFLFWTIVWFGRKMLKLEKSDTLTSKDILVFAGAFLGAISFAFTDSFWFSAVEGEVYATSSLFIAMVFWAILRWEREEDEKYAMRWIILIFYMVGLSVGIHLLNVLAFPAMALVYYFKKYNPTVRGVIFTLIVSSILLMFMIFMLVPGVARFAAYFDLMFVNGFNLPVYSGALTFVVLMTISIILLIRYTIRKRKFILQTIVLSFMFWMIGYSTFTVLIIRSNANPYVDMNNVENIFGLVDYLNREQYPKRPLVYGNNYNSPIIGVKERFTYKLYDGEYLKDELNPKYEFDKRTMNLFPRMASMDQSHESSYREWVDIKGKRVRVTGRDGKPKIIQVPTIGENIQFFFRYQLGHMYFRYFMWNFSGRQNNIQGFGDILNGNWISGIDFIDESRLGNQEMVPKRYKDNPAHNTYYMLPFILGIVGMIYQYRRDKRNFSIAFLFYMLTGVAIVVYLNEIPATPRERDYVHVGSFYAFSIWLGLGTIGLMDWVKTKAPKVKFLEWLVLAILLLAVPFNLAKENWDDHDRSGRSTARDYASNMLNSCTNAGVLFTTADNDTYPLWYAQEIEQIRRDVRSIIMQFVPVGWYVDQLHEDFQGEGAMPISFTGQDFLRGQTYFVPLLKRISQPINLKEAIKFVASDNPQTQVKGTQGMMNYLPSNQFYIPINKEKFLKTCSEYTINEEQVPDTLFIEITADQITRDDLILLDIIANIDWERPLYFVNHTILRKLGLNEYLHREGMVFRFMPFKVSESNQVGFSNADYQYDLITNQFEWGGVGDPDVTLDWTNVRIISSMRMRSMFSDVSRALVKGGDKDKAVELLDKGIELFPVDKIPHNIFYSELIESYYIAGEKERADELVNEMWSVLQTDFNYFQSIDKTFLPHINQEIRTTLYLSQLLIQVTDRHSKELSKEIYDQFTLMYQMFM